MSRNWLVSGLVVAAGTLALAPAANGATLYSNLAGGGSDISGTGQINNAPDRIAQPFVPTQSGAAHLVGFYGVSYLNHPATVSISIYSNSTDNGGQPGTLLATGAQAVIGDSSTSVPTCTALNAFPALSAGQTYWAVFQTYNQTAFWSTASQGGGTPKTSSDSGAHWPAATFGARSLLVDSASSCEPDIVTIPKPNPDPNAELGDMYAKPGGTNFQTLSAGNTGVAELKLTAGSFSNLSPGTPAGMFKLLNGDPNPNAHPPGSAFTFPKTLGSSAGGVILMYIACTPPLGTPDGMYTATFTLTSNDPDESPLTWPVWCILDSTPPSLEFTQNPDGRNGWFVTNPAPLQIRGVDPESGNRVKHIFCSDSAGAPLDWPNGSIASFTIQPEGIHALSCQGTDLANNTSAPGAYTTTVKIDTTAPETTKGDVGPPAVSDLTGFDFSFTGSDATSGVQEFECSLDGGPYELCTSPASRGGLGNATHTFDVRARDGAGTYDPTPVQWTWDVNAPAPQAADDTAAGADGDPLDIDVLANDVAPRGEPLHIALDGDTSEMGGAVSVAGPTVRYVPPAGFAGTDRFSYRAVNGNGVASEPATVTVQVAPKSGPGTADNTACDTAKHKLAKAKAKLRKLKQRGAPKQAIDKAKAAVKKRRKAVKAACAGT
jgi:hypothetical protein